MSDSYVAKIRIPTEMYAYIELDVQGTPEELIDIHNSFLRKLGGKGVDDRTFNQWLDEYLWGNGTMNAEVYESMNKDQQMVIQAIKKSRKRKAYGQGTHNN